MTQLKDSEVSTHTVGHTKGLYQCDWLEILWVTNCQFSYSNFIFIHY